MIFFCFACFWAKDVKYIYIYISTLYLSSVTLTLEPEITKITLRVTWPWRTGSRLIVTVWNYIYLTSSTLKTCKTKKKIIALAPLEPEITKVMLMVTWSWRTRSRLIVTVWKYIYLTSLILKTCKIRKDRRSNVTRTRENKGHAQGHVTLRYRVTLDSYSV